MSQAVVKYRMNVAGVVQGVGFRYMTKILADEMDGSVTIEAVGNYQDMSLFIERVKASPAPYGRVDKFQIEKDTTIPDYTKFKVTY